MKRVKSSHRRQRDDDGLTAKDRVYQAFLANQSIASEQAAALCPMHSVDTIRNWLRAARQMWVDGAPHERGLVNVKPCVPQATRRLWNEMRDPPSKWLSTEYWARFRELSESRGSRLQMRKPDGRVAKHPISKGIWLETIANFRGKSIAVSLVLDDGSNERQFDRIRAEKTHIEEQIGSGLEWHDENPGVRRRTVKLTRRDSDPNQRDKWGEQHEWLCETLEAFHRVMVARLDAGESFSDWMSVGKSGRARGMTRQPDPFIRKRVEDAAVVETKRYFTKKGYTVDSFEKDNVGWDLEAVKGRMMLRLEVKGLSGSDLCVELTPNEYSKMRQYRDSYRICVVTNALTSPKLTVFAFSNDMQCWADQDGRPLAIEEIVAARCRVARR